MARTKRGVSRRTFLGGSTLLVGAAGFPFIRTSGAQSANDAVRIAVVGLRGRGRSHIRAFGASPGVRVVALCDVDRRLFEKTKKEFPEIVGNAEVFVDYRQLLERDDIDAVSIATPNHWHALQTIWACQAGKDVYVEKPVSHNIWEGRQAVRAAEKYGRIVQAGTQIRSSPAIAEAFAWAQEGHLGAIEAARGLCYKPRQSIGKVSAPTPVDPAVDYDLWLGPAPKTPLMRERLHYDWHWVHATGNGDLGNQGIHQMDLCRWALGEEGLAPRVMSVGGRVGYDDDGDTPNSQIVYHQYEKAPLIFEVRGLPKSKAAQSEGWRKEMDEYMGVRIGAIVHCEGGYLQVPSYSEAHAHDKDGNHILSWKGGRDQRHYDNFINAVRSRRKQDLNGPLIEGHVSSALCHVGNVSIHCGEGQSPRKAAKKFADLPMASEAIDRLVEHLVSNEIDPDRSAMKVGALLEFDAAAERFSDEEANRWLSRDYRAPFVVPDTV